MEISSVTAFSGISPLNVQQQAAQRNAQTQASQYPASPAHEAKETPAEEARGKQVKVAKIGNIVNTLVRKIKMQMGRLKMRKFLTVLFVLVCTSAAAAQVTGNKKVEFTDPATNMEFVPVKGGCYRMGSVFGDGEDNERPVHQVCVDDFYMGKYEVTVGEFRKFATATGYRTEAEKGDGCSVWIAGKWVADRNKDWRTPGFSQDDRHPVVCVSWNDVAAFADWMSGTAGRKYRLPTEAEWEYAAKSGGRDEKWAGTSSESEVGGYAWSKENAGDKTNPVGRKTPNGLGLYDMSGNVFEWVGDWYSAEYYGNSPKDNPSGPSNGREKSLRGGSWDNRLRNIRTTIRRRCAEPASRLTSDGFRLAMPARQ